MSSQEFAISPIGISLFLVALISGALWNRRRFLSWAFFFAPLFDLPIMSIRHTRVTPFHAVILGWTAFGFLRAGKLSRTFRLSRSEIALLFWLAIVWLSLLMPIIFKGDVNVVSIHTSFLNYGNKVPLHFTLTNVTQAIYPTFMIWAVLVTRRAFRVESDITRALNGLLRGVTVVVLSGLFVQFGIFFGGHHFLHVVSPSVWGSDRTSDIMARVAKYDAFGLFPRMYTLAGEPGFTANLFATVLTLVSVMVLTMHRADSTRLRQPSLFASLSMLLIALFATGSTAGYLGVTLAIGLVFVSVVLPQLAQFKLPPYFTVYVVLSVTSLLAIFAVAYLVAFNPLHYLISKQVEKVSELHGSGAIRMRTVIYSIKLFFALPLLGVGFGSHRSGALITSLLSNIGAIGTLAFVGAMFFYIAECVRDVKRAETTYRTSVVRAVFAALLLWLSLSAVSVSGAALLFPWFWLLLALIGACSSVQKESTFVGQSVLPQTGRNNTL